jgi:ATP:corrinoid adenosyltransferase
VSKDDELPLVVCFSCLEEVKIVKALYTKCRAADVVLKGHLAKQSDYEVSKQ